MCSYTNTQPQGEGSRQVPRAISAGESRETLREPSPGHGQTKPQRRENITAPSQGAACKGGGMQAPSRQGLLRPQEPVCLLQPSAVLTAPQVSAQVPQSLSALFFTNQSLGENPCVVQSVLTTFCHQQHQGCAITVCLSQQPWAGCPQWSPRPVPWDPTRGRLLLVRRAALWCRCHVSSPVSLAHVPFWKHTHCYREVSTLGSLFLCRNSHCTVGGLQVLGVGRAPSLQPLCLMQSEPSALGSASLPAT